MKRLVFSFLSLAVAFLFLSAISPPYQTKELEVLIDGQEILKGELKIDVSHAIRAEKAGGYHALYLKLLGRYDAKEALNYLAIGLGDRLSAECERQKIDPLDAALEWTKNISAPFIYYEEKSGRAADLAEVGEIVARALDSDSPARAYACTREVAPDLSIETLRERTKEIGRFSTTFRTSGENRRHNLALAANAISGVTLPAGARFSFNEIVGERSSERGFRDANVVVNGVYVKGVGGGVCQVSTTLYNAVLLADLPIEKAAAHSIPVSYVPCSRDCTVSSAIDFVFQNDTPYPLYIAADLSDSTLTFVLYGEKKEGTRRLESEIVERIPYQAHYEDGSPVNDPSAATLLSPGREGIRSRLYALTERPQGVTRTLIRENYYAAKDAVYQKAA